MSCLQDVMSRWAGKMFQDYKKSNPAMRINCGKKWHLPISNSKLNFVIPDTQIRLIVVLGIPNKKRESASFESSGFHEGGNWYKRETDIIALSITGSKMTKTPRRKWGGEIEAASSDP